MSVTTEKSAGATAVRPFTVPVTSEAELEALRTRVAATRHPPRPDRGPGPRLGYPSHEEASS